MLRLLLALILALFAAPALADAGDIAAAARGVVRVVIVAEGDEGVYPVSHGSGFVVAPGRIVTNAHVVAAAREDAALRVAIVPPESGGAVVGRVLAFDARRDLALIAFGETLRLPALAVAGGAPGDSGEVAAVGYPMNVDRAQGLTLDDIFSAQPPVKSRGDLSGSRSAREFASLLHTAPIARGNSGGPLLDSCGRVLGVNSFGAEGGGADGEFYFAVAAAELVPFLRANGVSPRVNTAPCRSLADLDADERARSEGEAAATRSALERRAAARRQAEDRARFEAQMRVLGEREDRLLASVALLLAAAGLGWWAAEKRAGGEWPPRNRWALTGAGAAVAGALFLQVTRPGIEEVDRLASAATENVAERAAARTGGGTMRLICRLDAERSRVTTSQTDDVRLDWQPSGCVNGRTQYGLSQGDWTRVLVPNDDQEVSVNRFDPARREFRTERYLLSQAGTEQARAARGAYSAPSCGVSEASRTLGEAQQSVLDLLPARPNERLVYECQPQRE
ncbi:S1 family peptidase [Qipengyuania sediminis]|uniref:S1 family peptidase n=1 Tax=Qipengyuania sediminis TaxID=1532023 RepID=UPI001059B7BB|nr:serine protease [Qipengyuania sediminis]